MKPQDSLRCFCVYMQNASRERREETLLCFQVSLLMSSNIGRKLRQLASNPLIWKNLKQPIPFGLRKRLITSARQSQEIIHLQFGQARQEPSSSLELLFRVATRLEISFGKRYVKSRAFRSMENSPTRMLHARNTC